MQKLIRYLFFLFLLLVLADRLTAWLLEKGFYKQYHGDDALTRYILDSATCDILICGSSRASHHYISEQLEQSLQRSVWNAGRDNMGIHYTRAMNEVMFKRHTPRVLIFDLIPYNFLIGHQDKPAYFETQTTVLLPFAKRHPQLFQHIRQMDEAQYWKGQLIATYAYNSLAGSIIQNAFTPLGHRHQQGYEPLKGRIDTVSYRKPVYPFPNPDLPIDSAALACLDSCLYLCRQKNIQAVLCFSPFYFPLTLSASLTHAFHKLADRYHAPVLDYSQHASFVLHPELFYDELHLNEQGAETFSSLISADLRHLVESRATVNTGTP